MQVPHHQDQNMAMPPPDHQFMHPPPQTANFNQIVYQTEDENYIKCGLRIDNEFAKMKKEIEKIKTDGSVPAEQVMD